MAIPFITNVGFTDVSSSGSLNTKAGDKTKLPVQFLDYLEQSLVL